MNWPGTPPPLDRVPAIWPPDAAKLMGQGVETVSDLVDYVRTEGLAKLGDRSGIPVDQLGAYFRLAEQESSKARFRRIGTGWLVAVFLGTSILAFVTGPEGRTDGEELYRGWYEQYQGGQGLSEAAIDSLQSIVNHYTTFMYGDSASASAARDSLEALIGSDIELADGTMSPQLANLLSLRAATYQDAAMLAAAGGDLDAYEALYQQAQRLNSWLAETPSHGEYARENSRSATTQWTQLATSLPLGAEARIEDSARARSGQLAAIQDSGRRASVQRAVLQDGLEDDIARLTGAAEALNARTESALASASVELGPIHETLARHTEMLNMLLARSLATGSGGPVEIQIDGERSDESEPTLANPEEARQAFLRDGWPQGSLSLGGTVRLLSPIGPDGLPGEPVIEASSGDEELDQAAQRVFDGLTWNPADVDGRPIATRITRDVTYSLPFGTTYRDMTSALNSVVLAINQAGATRVADDLSESRGAVAEARELLAVPALSRCESEWTLQNLPGWTQQMLDVTALLCENRLPLAEQIAVADSLLVLRGTLTEHEARSHSAGLVGTWSAAQNAYDSRRDRIEDSLLLARRDGGTR